MQLAAAAQLAQEMTDAIVSGAHLAYGDHVALLVNNLGATTAMELAIFGGHALRLLQSQGILIERVYTGAFMTSLEAAGVSLTTLRVDHERLALLDAPTSAPAWPNATGTPLTSIDERIITSQPMQSTTSGPRVSPVLRLAVEAACDALVANEARLTELDRVTGDGDLGTNLARGASAVRLELGRLSGDAASVLRALALECQRSIGGSSGPFYSVMLLRASQVMDHVSEPEAQDWARAALAACDGISTLGGANAGDRTMLDALVPFATELNLRFDLASAVSAAEAGARATAEMKPRRGRASYLGERVLGHPDPGALAVCIWLNAISEVIRAQSPGR
jgi:dihydroxyacetone kinase